MKRIYQDGIPYSSILGYKVVKPIFSKREASVLFPPGKLQHPCNMPFSHSRQFKFRTSASVRNISMLRKQNGFHLRIHFLLSLPTLLPCCPAGKRHTTPPSDNIISIVSRPFGNSCLHNFIPLQSPYASYSVFFSFFFKVAKATYM